MGLIAKKTGSNVEPCPAGNHIARCIAVIDLGTQIKSFKGKNTPQRRARITWELPEEQKVFKTENGMQPYLLSHEYTLSLSDKAILRKDLASWRGRDFTQQELEGFDLKNILDKCCMLNVIHKQKEGSSDVYANVSSVAAMPKGIEIKARINPLVFFSLEEYDEKVFSSLNETTRAKIQLSPEFQKISSPNHFDTSTQSELTEEDIPF